MKVICLLLVVAAMMYVGSNLEAKPAPAPAETWYCQPAVQDTEPAREYYAGYEVVEWVDAYNVILNINGQEVGVSIQPEPSNWEQIVDWEAFDVWMGLK